MTGLLRLCLASLGLALATAAFAAVPASASAATLYVSNVTPPGDGTSCAQPGYGDPQDAIDASADGDTIVICAGTYPGGYDLDGSAATTELFIEGEGIASTIVDGGTTGADANPRLFFDSDPGDIGTVHFSRMLLRDGYAVDGPGEDGGGGAIALWADGGATSDLTVDTVEFQGNWAEGSGGAIRAGDVTITSSTFTGNRAIEGAGSLGDRGGAIKAEGTVEVADSEFTQNYALDQGGAISTEGRADIHSSDFESNESDWDGGAIFAPSGLAVTSTEFATNTANDSGGAVWASGVICVDYFEADCPAAPEGYTGEGTTFRDNETEGNNGNGRGGGLYSANLLYMDGALFTGNSADDSDPGTGTPSPDGGGLFTNGTALVVGSTFTLNTAVRQGGGVGSSGSLTLVESAVTLNSNTGDGGGGGIWAQGPGLELIDSTVSDNLATSLGGGLQSEVGDLLIDGTTFSGNESQNVGGGVFLSAASEAIVVESSFTENEAAGGGGGVLADGAGLTVDDSTFTGNVSGSGGDWPGGGAIAGSAETIVTGSTFSANRAVGEGSAGGAIAAPDDPGSGEPIVVSGSTFTGNEAAAFGGAIASLESLEDPSVPTVLVEDSTFANSDETLGGAGIVAIEGTTFVIGSTFDDLESFCAPAAISYVLVMANSTVTRTSGGGGEVCEGIEGAIVGFDLLALGNVTLSGNSTTGLVSSLDEYLVANSILDHDGEACRFEGGALGGIGGNVLTDRTTGCDSLVGGPPPSLQGKVSVSELGLGPLADNGGPTETMAIGPGSAAIGVGVADPDSPLPCLPTDQRGFDRPEGECDSGAYQYVAYDLAVTKGGSGGGIVTSTPAGIDCGASCSASFELGTQVTLTADPAAGSRFIGWSGAGCSGTGPCEVMMSRARLVDATFSARNPGVRITPATSRKVKLSASARKLVIARVTCVRQSCSIRSAGVAFQVGGRNYRAKASFPTASFAAGKSRVVSAVLPRRAFSRLGSRTGIAGARVVAVSEDRTRAQRRVQVRFRR